MRVARYLVRFDDICATMNWEIWERIEEILVKHDVRPILAVVPCNADPRLVVDRPNVDFWARVRGWQQRGWTIALHGYRHVYETEDAGLLGLNRRSEFAGLPREVQSDRIAAGLQVLRREGIVVRVWVAPAHSFDLNTVEALFEKGVTVISDGFFFRPVRLLNTTWIPQQLWRFRPMPFGTWTVCYHHNTFRPSDLDKFERDITHYAGDLTSIDAVESSVAVREARLLDRLTASVWLRAIKLKRVMRV